MSKRDKFKNGNQYQLDFQVGSESFPQKEKELNSLDQFVGVDKLKLSQTDQFVGADKLKLSKTVQFMEFDKAGLSEKAQSAGAFKFKASQKSQSKDLSKTDAETKIKDITCSDKKAVGLFFDNLISVKTVAERLGLAPKTIHNWVYLRKIPYVKCGQKVMFRPKSLKAWLNQKEIKSWQ